jgi:hypothetical protein
MEIWVLVVYWNQPQKWAGAKYGGDVFERKNVI